MTSFKLEELDDLPPNVDCDVFIYSISSPKLASDTTNTNQPKTRSPTYQRHSRCQPAKDTAGSNQPKT